MKILEIVDKKIAELEAEVKYFEESFEGWHEEIEKEGYPIAGDFFGHSDDCFDMGIEYGEGLKARETLTFLKKLRGGE